jgi:hypothetical protein
MKKVSPLPELLEPKAVLIPEFGVKTNCGVVLPPLPIVTGPPDGANIAPSQVMTLERLSRTAVSVHPLVAVVPETMEEEPEEKPPG